MTSIIVAATTRIACRPEKPANLETAERLVREAAGQGDRIILLQERSETLYFCQVERAAFFSLATPMEENPAIPKLFQTGSRIAVLTIHQFI